MITYKIKVIFIDDDFLTTRINGSKQEIKDYYADHSEVKRILFLRRV